MGYGSSGNYCDLKINEAGKSGTIPKDRGFLLAKNWVLG
jgi:hypothetical protein